MRFHFLNLVFYSIAVGVLFSLFMREGVRARARFAAVLAGSMVAVAVAVGWVMYVLG
jgi:hypothetical protein